MARVLQFRPRSATAAGQPQADKQNPGRVRRFLDETSQRIFWRWMRDQDSRYLARKYSVRRVEIEHAIRDQVRRRLNLPGPEEQAA